MSASTLVNSCRTAQQRRDSALSQAITDLRRAGQAAIYGDADKARFIAKRACRYLTVANTAIKQMGRVHPSMRGVSAG